MKKTNKISVIFSILLILQGCTNYFANHKMVFQLVDYNCKPIPDVVMMIIDANRGYLSSGVKNIELTTDKMGFIVYSRKYVDVKIMQRKHQYEDYAFTRHFYSSGDSGGSDLTLALENSSKENPVYIYPYDIARRKQTTRQSRHYIIDPGKVAEHRIGEHGDSAYGITKLYIREMENNFVIEMISPEYAGLIAVTKSDLPFSEILPISGYKRELTWHIPKSTIYPKTVQSVYYFNNLHSKGVLTLDFSVFKNQFSENEIILHEFIDSIPTKSTNKLPQESCGGVAARYYDGHYGHIYKTIDLKRGLEAKSFIVNDDNRALIKAKDIHTKKSMIYREAKLGGLSPLH
jgi:hypothetical protein